MLSFKKTSAAAAALGLFVAVGAVEAQFTRWVMDTATWNAGTFGAGLDVHKFSFLRSIGEMAASDADGYTFLTNALVADELYTFGAYETYTSASDVAAIKAWLEAQPDQNATGVTLKTWVPQSLTVGSVIPTEWTNAGINLQPFSVTSACDTTAVDDAFKAFNDLLTNPPTYACTSDVVAAAKSIYGAPAGTNCLGYVAFVMMSMTAGCADPDFVSNFASSCTDGAIGAAAFCDYATSMAASGQMGYGPVYSANADGAGVTYPTPEPATTTPAPSTPAPLGGTNAPGGAAGGIAPPALTVVAAVAVALVSAVLAA